MNSEFNFMSLIVTFFCTTKFLTPSITNLELFDNKLEKVLNRKNRKTLKNLSFLHKITHKLKLLT